jgi:non-canonical poly(A) RNA polymerase PAPD5/7
MDLPAAASASALPIEDASEAALPPTEFLSVGAGIKEKLASMKAQKLAAKQKRAAAAAAAAVSLTDHIQQEFLSMEDSAAQQFAHSAHSAALAAAATPATPADAGNNKPFGAGGEDFISLSFGDFDSAGIDATPARASGMKRKAGTAGLDAGSDGDDASSSVIVSEGAYKAPWATSAYAHRNFTVRLHEELLDFCTYVSPKPEEQQMRAELIQRLDALVKEAFPNSPNVHLKPFGSYATKLYLPISDIDLVLFNADEGGRFSSSDKGKFSPLGVLERVMRQKQCAIYLEHITGARIPILKLTDKATGVKVDICYDVSGGLKAAEFIVAMQRQLPALRPLTLFLKYFLHCRVLNDTYKGGIGSFMLQLMLIGHLQHLQLTGKLGLPTTNLGMLLMSFLESYGVSLNYRNTGLNMNAAQNAAIAAAADAQGMPERNAFAQSRSNSSARHGFFNKSSRGWFNANRPYLLSIENPLDASHDVGANSYLIMRVRKSLQFAYQTLSAHVFYENAKLDRREPLITKIQRQAIARATDSLHPFTHASHTPLTLLSLIVSVNDELRADQVEVEFDELAAAVADEDAQRKHRGKNVHIIDSSTEDEEEDGQVHLLQPDFVDVRTEDEDDALHMSERHADVDVDDDDAAADVNEVAHQSHSSSEDDESVDGLNGMDDELSDEDVNEYGEGGDVSDELDLEDLDDPLLAGPNLPSSYKSSHTVSSNQRKKSVGGMGGGDFIPLTGGNGVGGLNQSQRGSHKKGKGYRFDNPPKQYQPKSGKKKRSSQIQRGMKTGGIKPNNGIFESKRSKDKKSTKKKQEKARKKQRT